MKKVKLFIAIITITASYSLTGQVSITTDGSAPDGSATLEVKSTDKGMLIPRVALTGTKDIATINSPAYSLLIFNTAKVQDVIPGFYYWNGAAWTPLSETPDGSETKITPGANVTVTGVGDTENPYVVNASVSAAPKYSVGDFAHGGIVFWLEESGQHGLVCAKEDDQSIIRWWGKKLPWRNRKKGRTQSKGDGPYAGKANTRIIIAATVKIGDDGNKYAARVCNELEVTVGEGDSKIKYGDWYLPSKYELNLMFLNKELIDSTATASGNGGQTFHYDSYENYWSSTERSGYHAWYQSFISGHQTDQKDKSHHCRIRAVRAF